MRPTGKKTGSATSTKTTRLFKGLLLICPALAAIYLAQNEKSEFLLRLRNGLGRSSDGLKN
jgi:hypothetical protein